MKPIHYLGLAVRLFAICLMVYGASNLIQILFSPVYGFSNEDSFLVYLFVLLIPILLSIFLWLFPLTIASKILGSEEKEFEPVNPKGILAVLVASIGLFYLFESVIDGLYWLTLHRMMSEPPYTMMTLTHYDKASIASSIVELVLAFGLLCFCKSIAKLIARFSR